MQDIRILDYDNLRYQASTALGEIGDEAALRELVERAKRQDKINLAGFGERALSRIVEEIENSATPRDVKVALAKHVQGSRN